MIPPRGLGLTRVADTPTPNPNPFHGEAGDPNVTRLSSIGLTNTPHTPRRQRIVDMMGEEVIGDLPHLLSELKLQLQALGPTKSSRTGQSSLAVLTGMSQEGPVSFKCDRVGYHKALTLVDFCHRLATVQSTTAPATTPEALMAGVHASIQAMESRTEEALTEQASTLAKAIESLSKQKAPPAQRTYAQSARSETAHDTAGAQHKAQKPPKQQQNPPPKALPELSLTQAIAGGNAELDSKAGNLADRINTVLKEVCSPDPPIVRGLRRIHRTGDIVLQFTETSHAAKAQEESHRWLPVFNPELKLKTKLYTIMVHGIPTSFNPADNEEVSALRAENAGLLDSMQSVRWANAHSIAISKAFSSVFISLSNPEEASNAIFNKVCFEGELKTTERSKKHAGAVQCYRCQAYGHTQAACPNQNCCAYCTGKHESSTCTRVKSSTHYCINCTEAYVEKERISTPSFDKKDIPNKELAALAHSAQAANCPIRRALAGPNRNRDYFPVTKQNARTHAAR